jgi:hypothetical protein
MKKQKDQTESAELPSIRSRLGDYSAPQGRNQKQESRKRELTSAHGDGGGGGGAGRRRRGAARVRKREEGRGALCRGADAEWGRAAVGFVRHGMRDGPSGRGRWKSPWETGQN